MIKIIVKMNPFFFFNQKIIDFASCFLLSETEQVLMLKQRILLFNNLFDILLNSTYIQFRVTLK